MYCNLDIKYKAGRSKKEETREKKEVKAKNVGTVRERERQTPTQTPLYFKEIKCSFVRQFNNCKITENGRNTIICVRKKGRL